MSSPKSKIAVQSPQIGGGITRRACLTSLAGGAAATAAPASWLLADETPTAIDAHTHFYDPTRPQGVPWPGKDDALLYRKVLPEELMHLARDLHVGGTIAVEASPWLEDNQWLLNLAAREPFIVGVVGRLDTAQADFAGQLAPFAENKRFRGIRINHDELQAALGHPPQLDRLRLLSEHDLELDVNGGPTMPADVARLAKAVPDLRIVINHAANLKIDGKAVPEEWRSGMRAAAAGARVYCKVSALAEGTRKTHGDAPADIDFYRPVLDSLWQIFGEDRLIYGSNCGPSATAPRPMPRSSRSCIATSKRKGRTCSQSFCVAIPWPPINWPCSAKLRIIHASMEARRVSEGVQRDFPRLRVGFPSKLAPPHVTIAGKINPFLCSAEEAITPRTARSLLCG